MSKRAKSYELSAAARLDLLRIWNYLAEHASLNVADTVLADLEAGMERVAERPGIGHARPDLTDRPLRFYLVHSYLIVFRPESSPLHVIRVLHGAQDIQSILAEGG
jgi:antitoxin ParD1/3/4/toxin ParE1/3/4